MGSCLQERGGIGLFAIWQEVPTSEGRVTVESVRKCRKGATGHLPAQSPKKLGGRKGAGMTEGDGEGEGKGEGEGEGEGETRRGEERGEGRRGEGRGGE